MRHLHFTLVALLILKPVLLFGAEIWGTSLAVEIKQIQVLQKVPRSK